MANAVFDAVRTVLAVREFGERPVPDDAVERMVEALRLTASSMNRQPWHFVIVRERASLVRLAEMLSTGRYIAQASGAIAVAIERDSPFGVSDASRAIQSLALTAWADGIGTNWVGFGVDPDRHDDVRRYLGLPDEYQVLAVIPFGYPSRPVGRGIKKRKPLGEVVSRERYGAEYR